MYSRHRSHKGLLLFSLCAAVPSGLVPPHIAAGINFNFLARWPDFPSSGRVLYSSHLKGNKPIPPSANTGELFSRGYRLSILSKEDVRVPTFVVTRKPHPVDDYPCNAARRYPSNYVSAYLHRLVSTSWKWAIYAKEPARRDKRERESAVDAERLEQAAQSGSGYVNPLANRCRS